MSDAIVPESRIFRIGRECYVVYLGKERDDVRPFLRIGNNRDIPQEVHEAVSTVVVTDDHVGNPLLEILNAAKIKGRYLGDTFVVGEIRRFFKSFDLPTDDVTDYRKVKDGEKRHMVWFYSSGNIHLRFDEQVIFDLHKREKEDRHFIRLYEEAKAEFLRNPLRYIKQDFTGPGVILSNGNAFWYEGGEILALEAHTGFVARLMKDGMDPDFISSAVYDMETSDMDSHDAAVYIGFVKRMRQRKKQLRVLTSKPELQRKLKLLFPARGEVPATMDVTDVSGRKKATFRDSIISRKDDKWRIHRAGLPEICINGDVNKGISINAAEGYIAIHDESGKKILRTPQGFPIDFTRNPLTGSQAMERYIGLVFNSIKDYLTAGESQAVTVLEKYLRMLKDDINADKASVSPLLKQTSAAARDGLKKAGAGDGGPSWYFFYNAQSLIGLLCKDLPEDHPLQKNAETVRASLESLLSRSSQPEGILPFWADLNLSEEPRLFWRVTKRGFVPADMAASRNVNDKITDITSLDEAPWKDDEERLLTLIRSLGQGGQGPLTDEQIALLQKPEETKKTPEKKTEEKAARHREQASSTDRNRDEQKHSKTDTSVESSSRSSQSSSSGRGGRLWMWMLLGLLVLLLGGVVAWDLSGSAPWGSYLASDGVSDSQSGAEQADSKGSDTGTGDSGAVSSDGDSSAEGGDSGDSEAAGTSAEGQSDSESTDGTGESTEAAGEDAASGSEGADGQSSGDNTSGITKDETTASVDPDVAPHTIEEVKAYLDVNGRVPISEADIHLAANEIAVLNGYKDLDYQVYTGDDPDWIYPGNSLELPEAPAYVIRSGDTIWFLAAREVRVDVEKDLEVFDAALAVLDNTESSADQRSDALKKLSDIASDSRAEVLRQMAAEAQKARQ